MSGESGGLHGGACAQCFIPSLSSEPPLLCCECSTLPMRGQTCKAGRPSYHSSRQQQTWPHPHHRAMQCGDTHTAWASRQHERSKHTVARAHGWSVETPSGTAQADERAHEPLSLPTASSSSSKQQAARVLCPPGTRVLQALATCNNVSGATVPSLQTPTPPPSLSYLPLPFHLVSHQPRP